ncbi:carboxypeptidase N subunit 2-like [Onthophagus taurus]|uniref:carboxypeptidase N subunit 2-like n=1 Tax=Onthophagus taurus TaxID=166361 RepID=UPI0039BE5A9E
MKYLPIFLLPLCIEAGLFHALVKEGCTFDDETNSYQCTKIRKFFPKMYYGDYRLNCELCDLRVFNKDTFSHRNALLMFNVTGSNMENITNHAFENLRNLQHIHLEHNKIINVSENAFAGLRHVYELHLEFNNIENLTEGFLNNFEANSVYISYNKLVTIPPGVFKGLHGVMSMDFSHNLIINLEKGSFWNVNGIEILNLSNNKLCSLPLGVFSNIQTLRDLNLSNNKFKTFPIGVFSPLKNLVFLNLSHNYFSEFDSSLILPLRILSRLDISGNGIQYLDTIKLHQNVPTLRHLVINDNLWRCYQLGNVIQELRKVNVDVSDFSYERFDIMNINGVACTDMEFSEVFPVEEYLKFVTKYSSQYYC